MTVWIALLRGINVGGHRKLPMADLKAIATDLGFDEPRTYLQSGNLVFGSTTSDEGRLESTLSKAIEKQAGFPVEVIVRSAGDWDAIVAGNPFPEAATEPKTLHVFLTKAKPDASVSERLDRAPKTDERFELVECTLYLHAPSGIGRSKFAAAIERTIKVPATARNWATVSALAKIASDPQK